MKMDGTYPRTRAQFLYRAVEGGLAYAMAAKRLYDLSLPEERRKNAEYFGAFVVSVLVWADTGKGGGKGMRARLLRVGEHDVRRAKCPARHMRVQIHPRREDSPCEGIIEARAGGGGRA
jgi:hypothetical protein